MVTALRQQVGALSSESCRVSHRSEPGRPGKAGLGVVYVTVRGNEKQQAGLPPPTTASSFPGRVTMNLLTEMKGLRRG